MIEAAVFDMDGLMIDSQPYWQDAQLEVLAQVGVTITRQDTIDTTGMRVDEIVRKCYNHIQVWGEWTKPASPFDSFYLRDS